jgi:hypothetical protein
VKSETNICQLLVWKYAKPRYNIDPAEHRETQLKRMS